MRHLSKAPPLLRARGRFRSVRADRDAAFGGAPRLDVPGGLNDACAAAQAQRIPFAKELPAGMFGHG